MSPYGTWDRYLPSPFAQANRQLIPPVSCEAKGKVQTLRLGRGRRFRRWPRGSCWSMWYLKMGGFINRGCSKWLRWMKNRPVEDGKLTLNNRKWSSCPMEHGEWNSSWDFEWFWPWNIGSSWDVTNYVTNYISPWSADGLPMVRLRKTI